MRRRVGVALAIAVTAFGSSGCGGGSSTAAPARLVSPAVFAETVQEADRVTVNVHVPFEGDVGGTDLSVAYDRVRAQADRLPPPGTPLAIYCRSGTMSAAAAPVLAELGYDDIVELDGGMVAWTASGRPLQQSHG